MAVMGFPSIPHLIHCIIDPFHVCENAAKLEDKTKEICASVKTAYCSVLQFGCIPTEVKGVYLYPHLAI